ncbi:MAG: hypothetical protein K9J13_12510 [Saprospiraceae bacterium]|nr:hypothetical protein [Saprospiraceae bacterium]
MLEFSIYKPDNKKTIYVQIVIIAIAIIVFYFLFSSINPGIIVAIVFVIMYLLIRTDKKKEAVGKIQLDYQRIIIKTEAKEIHLDISKIDRFELIYSGYNGKRVIGDFVPRYNIFSGIDNYLIIEEDNIRYDYKFLVETELQEYELIELIKVWENLGFDTSKIKMNI